MDLSCINGTRRQDYGQADSAYAERQIRTHTLAVWTVLEHMIHAFE